MQREREGGGGGGGEGKREGRVQNIHVSSYDIEHVFSKCDMSMSFFAIMTRVPFPTAVA